MKILCMCEHGNVRSVALAYLIKTIYQHDVLACGIESNNIETVHELCDWADKILVLEEGLWPRNMPEKLDDKMEIVDVGEDVWHNPFDHNLQHKLLKRLKDLNL